MIDLKAIRARADAATPGPWEALPDNGHRTDKTRCHGIVGPKPEKPAEDWEKWERVNIVITDSGYYPPRMPDAVFIAAARQDVPALCDRVEALEREYREALKYAEHAPHCTYGYSHHRECSCGLTALLARLREAR